MNRLIAILLGSVVFASVGCITYDEMRGQQRRSEQVARSEEQRIKREREMRFQHTIDDLQSDLHGLKQKIFDLEQSDNDQFAKQSRLIEIKLSNFEKRLYNLEANRKKDKQEIIDRLSRTVADILKSHTSSRASSSSRKTKQTKSPPSSGSEFGYEHIVEPGETLSAIAAAYNVSSKRIMEANNITNPNHINIGQRLFIPEE